MLLRGAHFLPKRVDVVLRRLGRVHAGTKGIAEVRLMLAYVRVVDISVAPFSEECCCRSHFQALYSRRVHVVLCYSRRVPLGTKRVVGDVVGSVALGSIVSLTFLSLALLRTFHFSSSVVHCLQQETCACINGSVVCRRFG